MNQAMLVFPTAHPSHRLRNYGWGDFACEACGLGAGYTAIERPCAGVRRYACGNGGYWQPDFGRVECLKVFDSRRAVSEHWFEHHLSSASMSASAPMDALAQQSALLVPEVNLSDNTRTRGMRTHVTPTGISRIVSVPDVQGGEPVVKGTRIPVASIVLVEREYGGVDGVRFAYPQLTAEDVADALAYYLEHRDQIDRFIQALVDETDAAAETDAGA